ncbi:tetratricopeptide repeat-containing sensor histidine kinase [Dyadobacter sp. CY356]|uniref:tetratricopeptide repeat-containing sensor histidine kinase n=1 Tax=Dyadobacter sp. CY356 TaxID=2906442 RepID=UPI001F20FC2D|nr:tetratricopeptide repeat-containing sensor histidine kinase [Dyadobacter sp. CY356]MCF0059191.1 tetratricopeptide repeat-containing sensor histidine kinase [Dyadobacter sp. CY356]
MKVIAIFILFTFIPFPASAQVEKIRKFQKDLPSIKDSTQYIDQLNRISLLFYEQNADSTLFYALEAREMSYRHQYPKGLADATNNLGIVYDIKGNIQLALRYYNDAYNQYTAQKDSSNIVQTLMNIATVYFVSGKGEKSVTNFDKALRLGNQISHDSITALVIYNYILSYPGKFTDKMKAGLIEKADRISDKYHDVRLKLAVQQLRANDLIAGNKPKQGIELLEKTLGQTLDRQLYYLSMDILMDLGDHYLVRDQEKGIDYYKKALAIAEEKNYRMYAKDVNKKLYEIYLDKHDDRTAFIYSQKLLRLFERQIEIDRISGIDYIEYAVKDQELISAHLKAEYDARKLWLAIAVCILTLLSIVFLWRNWKLSSKTNSILTLQYQQLKSTSAALEVSNHNYAKLIKMVAHDLRNPIGAVSSLSTLLRDESLSSEERQEFVELIQESSNSCLRLISDLLKTDFSFNEAELKKEKIDLSAFLRQALTLLNFRAGDKNQKLVLHDTKPATVTADRDKLLRVLNNLIVNAIKFSPEGETIQISTSRSKEGVTISVKDRGLGIPKSYAEKLFDPFTSSKREGTAGEQPFGLGLYISKQIVEAHRGKIWFESEEGKGSVFNVFLPNDNSVNS